LQTIDISINALSGTLPQELFQLPQLTSVAAGENCFDIKASFTNQICQGRNLTLLFMNGLETAPSCRINRFIKYPINIPNASHPFYPTTYTLIQSGFIPIPQCLFSLPNLQVLFLSGNAFTGNLEYLETLPANLTKLVLAHNYLNGSIPSVIQTRTSWQKLDLSFNRFNGTLSPDMWLNPSSASLALAVNRFLNLSAMHFQIFLLLCLVYLLCI
jgi:hypothetical protein